MLAFRVYVVHAVLWTLMVIAVNVYAARVPTWILYHFDTVYGLMIVSVNLAAHFAYKAYDAWQEMKRDDTPRRSR